MKRKDIINYILIFIAVFSFFKPGIIEIYPTLNNIFNYYTLAVSIFIVIIYLHHRKVSRFQLILIAQLFLYTISTLFGTHDIYTLVSMYIPFLAVSIFTELMIKKDKFDRFMDVLSFVIIIELVLNTLTIIMNPRGLYGSGMWGSYKYFMGYDNYSSMTLIIGSILVIINHIIKNKKITIKSFIIILLSIISYIITWAATPLLSTIITTILILFIKLFPKKSSSILNLKLFITILIAFFVFIVVFRFQNIFKIFIEEYLNKDLTFNGRTLIWDNCFKYFLKSPIIGNGVYNYTSRAINVGIYHAHCTMLNVLIEGGIIGLALYLLPILIISKKLNKIKDTEISKIISIGFLAYFILTTMDVFRASYVFYILLNIGYYSNEILNKYVIEEKK